ATWLLALVAVTAIGQTAGSQFLDSFGGGNSQSQRAQDLLARNFPADAGDRAEIVFHADAGIRAADVSTAVEAVLAKARGIPHVTRVSDPLAAGGRAPLLGVGQ